MAFACFAAAGTVTCEDICPTAKAWLLLQVSLYFPMFVSCLSHLQLEATLGVSISQVGVDDCPYTDCSQSGGCSNEVSFSQAPVPLSSGNISLVSLAASSAAQCGCRGREAVHLSCSAYPISPCLNGGTCQDGPLGYR